MTEPVHQTDRAALVDALRANMPQAMRALPQWLLWRFERYEGDKKPRKVPYYASGRKRRGGQGSVEDRAELVGFEPALAALSSGRWDGLGFAFLPGDGLIGIDIDGAISAEGEISDRAARIIEACASYTEYSPSSRGVHIIVAGETKSFKDNSIGLEVFSGAQFFTCTGRVWPGGAPQVAPLQDGVLRRLQVTVKGAKGKRAADAGAGVAGEAPAAGAADESVRRYCLAALNNAEQAMLAAGEGGRNHALNENAFGLAQLVPSGGLSETTVRAVLGDAARRVGLPPDEVKATLDSAIRAGLLEPRPIPPSKTRRAGAGAAGGGGGAGRGGDGSPPPEAVDGDVPPDQQWRALILRERGGKKDCRENVYLHLLHHPALKGLVAYDQFAHQVIKTRMPPWKSAPGEWLTADDYLLGLWLAQQERLLIKSEATLVAGVAMAAHEAGFHPVRRYLSELPAWDGVPRLPHWLHECLGAEDSDYTRLVGPWFVMGMIKRVQDPGCQLDYMLVLEGLQGKRKSSSLRVLAVRDEWFADTPVRIGTTDALLSIAGKWLYEFSEMDSLSRAEATAIKSYLSSRSDRVREPYARRHVDRPRSGVFAGTTNQSEYFKDPTGARRFWPVSCLGEIDLDKLRSWREQMFAEAAHRLSSGDPEVRRCWPTLAEEHQYLAPQQEQREIVDPWFERLATWLDSAANYGEAGQTVREVESFTASELLTKALNVPMDRIDGARQMATRVGIAMHRMGWHKRRDATGARVWRYWRPERADQPVVGDDEAAGGPAVVDGHALHEF